MTQSFLSLENSLVNSHVRAKPIPSHQLKNNKLGFRKNAILGGFMLPLFLTLGGCTGRGAFRELLCNQETFLQPAPGAQTLRKSVRVRQLSPVRHGKTANVNGRQKGL